MTPGEFAAAAEGARERAEREQEMAAWVAVTIVNGVGMRKQPLRMDELLGVGYLKRLQERALREKEEQA